MMKEQELDEDKLIEQFIYSNNLKRDGIEESLGVCEAIQFLKGRHLKLIHSVYKEEERE